MCMRALWDVCYTTRALRVVVPHCVSCSMCAEALPAGSGHGHRIVGDQYAGRHVFDSAKGLTGWKGASKLLLHTV
jgi:hypothetical protein